MNDSFVYTLFNKSIHQLELNDIISFFKNAKTETDKLEFKSYLDFENSNSTKSNRDKDKLNDIFKSICAFLNSDGGILIWGAPEGKNVEGLKEKVFSGDLTPVKYKIEKDQFINRLVNEISPTPHRVLFHSITMNQETFCYIFEITKSEFAPHQNKGTYFMRLDGSTRAAPHHYVEALIKKISFPKLEAYLSFGEMITGSEYAMLPIALTIHNLSKYIHERNVEYRILSTSCNILNPNQILDKINLNGSDIDKKAKKILHFNMPYYEEFVLVTKRMTPYSNPLRVVIVLSTWGELSPVIISNYEIEIQGSANANTSYLLKEKKENFYLYEKGEDVVDGIEKSNSLLLQSFEKRFYSFPIFKQLI
jgi:hypothetical protein